LNSEAISRRHHWAQALLPKTRWQRQVKMTSGDSWEQGTTWNHEERSMAGRRWDSMEVGHQGFWAIMDGLALDAS
jgi:hypothetical protein